MLTDDFEIKDLSFDLYNSKLESVEENLRLSMDLPLAEDYICKNFIM
jgi:hypothetical protein